MRDEMGLPVRPGATPGMDNRLPIWQQDALSLEQAISHLVLRRQNLDYIFEVASPEELRVREEEIDHTLEILRRVRP